MERPDNIAAVSRYIIHRTVKRFPAEFSITPERRFEPLPGRFRIDESGSFWSDSREGLSLQVQVKSEDGCWTDYGRYSPDRLSRLISYDELLEHDKKR